MYIIRFLSIKSYKVHFLSPILTNAPPLSTHPWQRENTLKTKRQKIINKTTTQAY